MWGCFQRLIETWHFQTAVGDSAGASILIEMSDRFAAGPMHSREFLGNLPTKLNNHSFEVF
jgi:hypothetical protein